MAYTVKPGDTLAKIAASNGVTVKQLLKLNPALLANAKYNGGKTIFVGTKINTSTKAAPKPTPLPGDVSMGGGFGTGSWRQAESGTGNTAGSTTPGTNTGTGTETKTNTAAGGNQSPTSTDTDPSIKYLVDPATGEFVLDPAGKKIPVGMGGTTNDQQDYFDAMRTASSGLDRARIANTLALEKARTQGDVDMRAAGRDIFNSQMQALNELARRGLSGAPGLDVAAQRAAAADPLARKQAALQRMKDNISAANALLVDETTKAAEAQRKAVATLQRATNISNKIGGKSNG